MRLRTTLFILTLIGGLSFFGSLSAQKIATIDMERILTSITEYQDAQKQLDQLAAKWTQEINQRYDDIKGLRNKLIAEKVLLSPEELKKREDEIVAKEESARELQRSRFGPDGALFQRRQELIRPIQEAVYEAVENYAENKGYDFIFDRASAAGIIFANDTYDKTDDILRALSR